MDLSMDLRSIQAGGQLELRVHAVAYEAKDVLLFDLRRPDGAPLPAFTPGAHLDVAMPGGISRSYSLLNDSRERHRYLLAVKREAMSRGGSAWMHEAARPGTILSISPPRNDFALDESASHSVLIAGGIGITPLWCMAQRLEQIGRGWELHYRARSREDAALLEPLSARFTHGRVLVSFSGEARKPIVDIVGAASAGTHFYCCGPVSMIEAFEAACAVLPPAQVHAEYFAAKQAPATAGGYAVTLAKSGRILEVTAGQSLFDALRCAGVGVTTSCQQGICGMCETKVLAGRPDHRDLVLSDEEKASGRTMMVCCSGSLDGALTLDL